MKQLYAARLKAFSALATLALSLFASSGFAQLTGVKTIGGASPDYATITAAMTALQSSGVGSGGVTFRIRQGTYTGKYTFGSITGMGSSNLIRFAPDQTNTAQVILTYASTTTSADAVVNFNGANYVRFDSLVVRNTGASYARGFEFNGTNNYITINACLIENPNHTSPTSSYNAGIYDNSGTANMADYITVTNCTLNKVGYGFYVYGGSTTQFQTWTVTGNTVNSGYMAMYFYYCSGEFNYNIVKNDPAGYAYPYGMYMYYCYNSNMIGNDIELTNGTYAYAMYLYYPRATSSARKTIANNTISTINCGATTYGFYVYYADYCDVIHNSVNHTGGGAYAAYWYYGNYVNFINNCIVNKGGSYSLVQAGTVSSTGQTISHNNFFGATGVTTSGNTGTSPTAVDPMYETNYDLHATSSTGIYNSGLAITGVLNDIDGQVRCPGTGCPGTGSAPDRGADEYFVPPLDAGVSGFPSLAYCAGTVPVTAYVRNRGTTTLTSVGVSWAISTNAGAWVSQTGITLTGMNLAAGRDTLVSLGTMTLATGNSYRLRAYTTAPNSGTDQQTSNDTNTTSNFSAAISGTFTVGGTSPDFATLTAALASISATGVCGPVVLRVRQGTYTGQYTIGAISGTSATNYIRIVPDQSNTQPVVFTHAGTTTSLMGVFNLNGVTDIIFDSLTIRNTGTSYARGFEFNGTNNRIKINACLIENPNHTSPTTTYNAGIYDNSGTANMADNITVTNCTLNKVGYGFYVYGGSTTQFQTWTVTGNRITGGYMSMYFYYCSGEFNYNIVKNDPAGYAYPYGMYMYYCYNSNMIGNDIELTNGTYAYAMYLAYPRATSSARKLIANNTISTINCGATTYGFYVNYADYCDVIHNSVNHTGGGAYAAYWYYGNYVNFINNCIVNKGGTYSLYQAGTVSSTGQTISHNNFFGATGVTTSGNTGTSPTAVDPMYETNYDLHATASTGIYNSGLAITGVLNDIDGQVRCPGTGCPGTASDPDRGADEYYVAALDASLSGFPSLAFCPGNVPVRVYVKNRGTSTLTSLSVGWALSTNSSAYVAQTPLTMSSINLLPGRDTMVTLGNATLASGNNYRIKAFTYSPNSSSDQQVLNDTNSTPSFVTAVSGTFTVGSATGRDFPNLDSAFNHIERAGICGPIVFNVDTGTYTMQVRVSEISGSSSVNNVTVQPSTTTGRVVLAFNSAAYDPANNCTVCIQDADYITFKGITIKALSTSYSHAVSFAGAPTNIKFINDSLLAPVTASTSNYNSVVHEDQAANASRIVIDSCTIWGGSIGVYLYGASSSSQALGYHAVRNTRIDGWYYMGVQHYYSRYDTIQNCDIRNTGSTLTYGYGIYSYYCDNTVIDRNKVTVTVTGYYYGCYIYYNQNSRYTYNNVTINASTYAYHYLYYCYNTPIIGNRIHFNVGTYAYGYIYYCGSTSTTPRNLIANNMISNTGMSGTQYTMYAGYLNYTDIIHNSVYTKGGAGYGIYAVSGTGTDWKNNISYHAGTGYGFYSSGSHTYSNNNFYAPVGTHEYPTGASQWNVDPMFVAQDDLHCESPVMHNAGSNQTALVPLDFDMEIRCPGTGCAGAASAPDVGADEFRLCDYDVMMRKIFVDYTMIPNSQSPRLWSRGSNKGMLTGTGIMMGAIAPGYNGAVSVGSLASGKDTLIDFVMAPQPTGTATAKAWISQSQTDCNNLNDTVQTTINITDSVLAYDNGTFDNSLGFNSPGTGEFGHIIDITNTDVLTSGSFYLRNPTQGANVRLILYTVTGSTATPTFTRIDSTRIMVVGANGTGWYSLPFGCAGVTLNPGKYLIVIEQSNPVRMELAILSNTNGALPVIPKTRWYRSSLGGTFGAWTDFDGQASPVNVCIMGLRANFGIPYAPNLLEDTTRVCNGASTWLKISADMVGQIWSNSMFFDSIQVSQGGQYSVTAWDILNCIYRDTTQVVVNAPIGVNYTATSASCGQSNGSAFAVGSGTLAPYTYKWSNGRTGDTVKNVAGGTYIVTVTDAYGCEQASNVEVMGLNPAVVDSFKLPTCHGDPDGVGYAIVRQGFAPITYNWGSAGNNPTAAVNTGLSAGSYNVTVTGRDNCNTVLTVVVQDPPVLSSNGVATHPTACGIANGIATANVSGGVPPYKFLWNNGQSTNQNVGLTSGSYDVTITDKNGCVKTQAVALIDPNAPVLTPNNLHLDCSYDTTTVSVNITGGTTPLSYTWNTNDKTSVLKGRGAGTYTVVVSDNANCVRQTTVVITAPAPVGMTLHNPTDNGENNVGYTARASGGTPGYTFKWMPSNETDSVATQLPNGLNTLIITDTKGCQFNFQIDVYSKFTGVSIYSNPAVYNVYPNPTRGMLNVDLNLPAEQVVTVKLLDARGAELRTISRGSVLSDHVQFDMSTYAVGMYILETQIGNETLRSKVQLAR